MENECLKKVIVFGLTDLADQIYRYNSRNPQFEIVAFTADQKYCNTSNIHGLPVVDSEHLREFYPPENHEIIIAVGYNFMNDIRKKIYMQMKQYGYKIASFVHSTAIVITEKIGEGNIILEGAVIGLDCQIGKCNIFMASSHLSHDCIVGDFNFFAISSSIAGEVVIKNNTFFGNNCSTNSKINIADYTLVGAGAYVSCDTLTGNVYVPQKSVLLNKDSRSMQIK